MEGEAVPPPFLFYPSVAEERPFLINVPHSGRYYPPALRQASRLDIQAIRLSEDAYVDAIFADMPQVGAAMMVATHARAYVDLNRAADELDPDMFHPPLAEESVRRTHRVRAGLGIIPAIVSRGTNIYHDRLPAREAHRRIEAIHRPYHAMLAETLAGLRRRHGMAVLIDCHSMPSADASGGASRRFGWGSGRPWPDIVLGDCWGQSCGRALSDLAEDLFIRAGFSVRRNIPYAGGYATRHYGVPGEGIHALQIELCRALYMDETTLMPHPDMPDIARNLTDALSALVQIFAATPRLAAE